MAVVHLYVIFIELNIAVSQTVLCVWNSIDDWDHLNGEYIYEGEYDTDEAQGSNSYWKRSSPSCPDPEQYIFAPYTTKDEIHYWSIYPSLQKNSVLHYPDCGNEYDQTPKFPVDPSQCKGGWTLWSDNKQFAVLPLTVTAGKCPSLSCDQIQVSGSGDSNCDHIFTKYETTSDSDHVYVYNNVYLYFNPYAFKWYCSDTLDQSNCNNDTDISTYYLSSKMDQWIDASPGEEFQLTMSNENSATFECISNTSSTTPQPTQNTVTPQVVKNQDIDCGTGITNNDICEIECDLSDPSIPNLYCRNAALCIIHCTNDWCLWSTQIHAENAGNLQFISTAQGCVEQAALYLPNEGNVSIIADTLGTAKNVLKSFNIHGGSATDHISIQCNSVPNSGLTKDCVSVTLDASNARFVSIDILHAEYVGDGSEAAVIQCPVDSPLSPSCVINATYAVSTAFMQISAARGIPRDVVFYSDGNGVYDPTTITCSNGVSLMQNDNTFIGTPCYWSSTLNPTEFPSKLPTTSSITTTTNPSELATTSSIVTTMNPSESSTTSSVTSTLTTFRSEISTSTLPSAHSSTTTIALLYNTTTTVMLNTIISQIRTTSNRILSDAQRDTIFDQNIVTLVGVLGLFAVTAALCTCFSLRIRRQKRNKKNVGNMKKVVISTDNTDLETVEMDRVISNALSATALGADDDEAREPELNRTLTTDRELVKHWLTSTIGKPQYLALFFENGYDSMQIVETIQDKTQLSDIGITMKGHQALIMAEIEKMRARNALRAEQHIEEVEEIKVVEIELEEPGNVNDDDDDEEVVGEETDEYSADSNDSLYEVQVENNITAGDSLYDKPVQHKDTDSDSLYDAPAQKNITVC